MSVGWAVALSVVANANLPSLSFLHNLATLPACCTASLYETFLSCHQQTFWPA
ncbi:uncharacterized protein PgNI_08929 [Pyricularia grisea]|uniref:Uncharacterized protein n=1 Tax=Pyricularia grisea TaxID=148305 RepID=A0A6P8AU61_PYRGI|nr:uncharacterized protein PgNI_08929 [Pyricularia grisea]TLD05756.1 hypothetical protein PgNI_08929 [Pyricularia grisea]